MQYPLVLGAQFAAPLAQGIFKYAPAIILVNFAQSAFADSDLSFKEIQGLLRFIPQTFVYTVNVTICDPLRNHTLEAQKEAEQSADSGLKGWEDILEKLPPELKEQQIKKIAESTKPNTEKAIKAMHNQELCETVVNSFEKFFWYGVLAIVTYVGWKGYAVKVNPETKSVKLVNKNGDVMHSINPGKLAESINPENLIATVSSLQGIHSGALAASQEEVKMPMTGDVNGVAVDGSKS